MVALTTSKPLRTVTCWIILSLSFVFVRANHAFAQDPSFEGKVVGVADGDTITVLHERKGEKIRLYGIDCPERHQDFGRRAKKETSDLVFGRSVGVVPKATDRYGRTIGVVKLANGTDINRLLVERGLCWWYQKYAPNDGDLARLEKQAPVQKIGVWSQTDPTPPWEFRHMTRRR